MTSSEFALYQRAFAKFPAAMSAFLAQCKKDGIELPTGDDDAAPAVDNTRPRPAPKPHRYDGAPGDLDGRVPGFRGGPLEDADPPFRSVEGKRNLKSLSALPIGPVRGADGVLRIHACCPREYRQSRGFAEPE
jgi:hypothetical protein